MLLLHYSPFTKKNKELLKMKKTLSEFRGMLRSAPPLLVSVLFLSVVGMNLLANKSIDTGVEWLALDCGVLFSGFTFLAMDVLTHAYGPRASTAAAAAKGTIAPDSRIHFFSNTSSRSGRSRTIQKDSTA